MSFLSDAFEGNFGNLGNDITHDPVGSVAVGAGLTAATLGLAAPAVFGGLGALGGVDAAAGGIAALPAEAAAGGIGALPGEAAAGGSSIGALLGGGAGTDALVGGTAGDTLLGGGGLPAWPTSGPNVVVPPSDVGGAIDPSIGSSSIAMPGEASTPTAGGGGGGGFNLASVLGKNPVGSAVAGGGLLYSILNGQKPLPTTNAIQGASNQAQTLAQGQIAQGQSLETYLQNGTLPPALQAQVTQATAAAKAQAVARAASMGMPTDPAKNSSLAADLADIDQKGLATAGQLESNLFQQGNNLVNTGAHFLNMSNQDLIALSNIQRDQTAAIGKSIASFAAALGGSSKIQIGGSPNSGITVGG